MSTRSTIALLQEDGTFLAIYCHFDGYPAGVGQTLHDHYQDEAKIKELMALGDISILAEEIGEKHPFDWYHDIPSEQQDSHPWNKWCLAYGRDRGEEDFKARRFVNISELNMHLAGSDCEYFYLYSKGIWQYRGVGHRILEGQPELLSLAEWVAARLRS